MSSAGEVHSLCISNLTMDDRGLYSLVAKNNVGSAITEANISVEGNCFLFMDTYWT